MSKTLQQIFAANPITSNISTDLMYFVQSPYTPGTDAGMTFANFSNQFVLSTAIINPAHGGTGVNNGTSTITLGGSLTTIGAFPVTLNFTAATNVIFPTSGTLATTSQIPSFPLSLANGGTNAALVANNGGIVWSNATQLQILAGTATANQILLSGATATPAWSTTTYPATNAINTIMYASSANILGVISAVNGGVLVSNNTGVPSMLANPAAVGKVLQSANAAIPTWSTPTFPTGSGASGAVLISDGTNYVASTSLWPNTVGTSGKVVVSNGTSNVYSTPTFPNASATTRKIIVSDGTNWVASTETCAVPGSANNVMLSDGTNWTSAALPAVSLPAGTLFNFQSATLTTSVTTTSTAFSTATGLSVTITPTSSSNKILVRAVVQAAAAFATNQGYFQLARASTAIGVGTSVGSRTACGGTVSVGGPALMETVVLEWVDSPATTSATTYNFQFASSVNAQIVAVNASTADANGATSPRTASIITACEIHA